MDQVEERLIEEVRKYEHLYNSSSAYYKDSQMSNNTWKEIAQNLGVDSAECLKRWKNLRDKFVRHRKRLCATRSGKSRVKTLPPFYIFMSWLEPHVKHRDTDSNPDIKQEHRIWDTESQQSPSTSESDGPLLPASHPPTVPVRASKRKGPDPAHVLNKNFDERQQKLMQDNDECSRFGQTVADMLRRVPEGKRADVMYSVFTTLYENRQQKVAFR